MERYNITVKENPFDGCPYADMVVSDDGAYMRYDDAKRALDAERARVKELEADSDTWKQAAYDQADAHKATQSQLQAQLRQVEGERDRLKGDMKERFKTIDQLDSDLTTLQQLVAALPVVDVQEVSVWLSPDESGWFVSKRPAFPAGLYWAKFRTQAEADSFRALLAYRATLAAGQVSTSIIGKQVPPSQWDKNAGVRGDIS